MQSAGCDVHPIAPMNSQEPCYLHKIMLDKSSWHSDSASWIHWVTANKIKETKGEVKKKELVLGVSGGGVPGRQLGWDVGGGVGWESWVDMINTVCIVKLSKIKESKVH